MHHHRRLAAATALIAVTFAACSGDSEGPEVQTTTTINAPGGANQGGRGPTMGNVSTVTTTPTAQTGGGGAGAGSTPTSSRTASTPTQIESNNQSPVTAGS